MRNTLKNLTALASALALIVLPLVRVEAGQRIRLIDVDSATTPAATGLHSVTNLTTATLTTNTVSGLTIIQSNLVKSITYVSSFDTTNIFSTVSVVTNVVIGVGVTNIQNVIVGTGFANTAQANQVISNNVILYQLLQSY